jgi:hypothetical protein
MSVPSSGPSSVPASTRLLTTLLASGWGLASAYTLFHSLLVAPDARLCFAALVPLIVVWATLERKRWGRLALLGLSATALGMFVSLLGLVAATGHNTLLPAEQNLSNYFQIALRYFGDSQEIALTVLGLAMMSGVWMRKPLVVAEFERGKRSTLAVAQKAIAMSLVAFWGVTVLLLPPSVDKTAAKKATPDHKSGKVGQPLPLKGKSNAIKPKTRSARLDSNS